MALRFKKHISKREHPHRDLSTSLRFGRDDKGEGGASIKEKLLNGELLKEMTKGRRGFHKREVAKRRVAKGR
jgi:hypothetical protein